MKTNTPMTDAVLAGCNISARNTAGQMKELARRLERDRADLIAALVSIGTMPTVGPLAAADMANIANRTLARVRP